MVKKYLKQSLSIFLALLIVLTNFQKPFSYASTQALTMQIINLNGDGSITTESEFWGEENIPAAANLVVSGDGVEIPNPWLLLTVPKIKTPDGSMKISKPTFVDSQNAYRTEKYEDDDNYYVLYKFRSVSGGTNVTFPFPFKFYGGRVRNRDELNIKFDMLQGTYQIEDATIDGFKALPKLHQSTKTYIGRAQEAVINESYHRLDYYARTDNARNAHVYTLEAVEGQTTTGEKGRLVHPNFSEIVKMGVEPNTEFTQGKPTNHIKPTSFKIEFDMPEYGVLTDNAKRAGWTYDEGTRVATLIKTGNDVPNIGGADWYRGWNPGITSWGNFINMVNAPFNEENGEPKIYTINSRYWVTNPGESEKRLDDRSSSFYLEPKYFEPGMNFYSLKDNYTNSGTADDGLKFNLNEGAHVYYDEKIFDKSYELTEEGMPYQLIMHSESNGTAYDNPYGGNTTKIWDVQDYLITEGAQGRLYYKSFMITNVWNTSGYGNRWSAEKKKEALDKTKADLDGNNTLYGVLEDGSLEVIAQNVKLGQKIDINDVATKYRGLKLSFENPVELNNTGFRMVTRTLPTQEELDKFDDGTYVNRQYYRGYFRMNKTHGAPGEVGERPTDALERWPINNHGHDYAYNSLDSISPKANIWTNGNDTVVFKIGGSEFDVWTAFSTRKSDGEWGPFAKEPIENVKYIKLLPPGFEFVRVNYKNWYNPSNKISEPTVVKNFRNSGRTALIYNIEKLLPENGEMDDAWIGEKLVATKYAEKGNNRIDSFLVYPKNNIIKPNSNGVAYKDELDLDEDGDTNEYFIRGSQHINYIPPLELIVKKEIAYDNKPNTEWGLVATGDLGYEFYYKVKIFNNTIADAKSAHVIDVLPYKGDHYIVANADGEYLDRGSKFATPLVGAIEDIPENAAILQKFDIFYQITPQGADLDSVRNGAWLPKDAVTDFAQVKSVKFVLKQGQVIPSKQEVNFIVKAKLPYDTTIEPGEVANNTPAIATDGANYAEGNLVSVTYTKYKVEGIFYKDINKDGLLREDEEKEGIQGRTVELIDADTGEVAVDFDGRAIPATLTDEEGKFSFEVFRRGNYKIRFTKLDTEEYTPNHFNNNVKASNAETIQDNVADTFKFELSPARDKAIQNVGVITTKRNVNVLKYYYEELPADAEEGTPRKQIPLEGATFELVSVSNPNVKFEARSGMDGILTFKNVPFGDYKLKETVVPQGYSRVISEEGQNVVVGENKIVAIKVENLPIKRDVKLTKVDADDNSIVLPNVEFGLYKVGQDDPVATATTNDQGIATFTKVPYGNYKLKEIRTVLGYVLRTTEIQDVNITEAGTDAIDLGQITNSKIKAGITLVKVDADNNDTKIQGAVFGLYKTVDNQEVEVMTATSNAQGLVSFTDVPFGEYYVKEKTPKEGYILSTKQENVNVDSDQAIELGNFENTKIKGSVTLVKVDAEDNTKLDGVVFGLYKTVDGQEVEVTTATTNDQGVATFDDVEYGRYYVKEKTAKEGYIASTTQHEVNIETNGQAIDLGTISNAKIKGSVIVTKVDAEDNEKKLQGVVFELKKGSTVVATETTNAQGVATFANVPYGEYKVVEKTPLANYIASTEEKDANIDTNNKTVELTFENQIKKGTIVVTKVDAEDADTKLKGVVFELKQGDTVIATETTNDDGVATFANVVYGEYKVYEKETLANYVLDTEPKDANIDANEKEVALTFENTRIKGSVKLVKVDAEDNTKLDNVVFGLYNAADDTEVTTQTTNSQGEITFADVEYGRYYVKEKTAKEGYVASDVKYPINIATNGQEINLGNISNTKIKGSVVVTKVDAENANKKLEGVVFELKKGGNVVDTQTTNAQGVATFANVPYGEYKVVEKTPLVNYNASTEEKDANIDTNNKTIELTFENQIKKGSVVVTKVDAEDNNKKLEGVVFELKQDDRVVDTQTTNAQGVATFADVIYGEYKVVEKTPLANYIASTEVKDANIDADKKVVELTFANQIKKGSVTFIKVDSENENKTLDGVVFELQQNGQKVYEATSTGGGVVTFAGVVYGDYKLVEKTPLENYNALTKSYDISINTDGQVINLDKISNVIKKGSVSVVKVDADDASTKLQGVVFGLKQGDEVIYRATTNENGVANFTGVVYGDYTLVELETLENYNLSQETRAVQVREHDGLVELGNFTNLIKKANVTLTKVDAEDENTKLEGVVFELKQGDVVKYTATTNQDGVATFENVIYGDYKLVEKSTVEGYVLDTTVRDVEVREHGVAVEVGNVANTKIKGTVTVTKVDADDNSVLLQGVEFVLKKGDQEVYRATTNENGVATFENVNYGVYTLVEKSTLVNYNLSDKTQEINISTNKEMIDAGTWTNAIKKGNVQFVKVEADNHENKIDGVVFVLSQNGIEKYEATSENGGVVRFENVVYGTYTLSEKSAPVRYNVSQETRVVTISEHGQLLELDNFTNTIKKGSITFVKVDEFDSEVKLSGATFELRKGDEVIQTVTTKEDGIVRFDNVLYGEYTIVETVVPGEKYNLLEEPIAATIDTNEQVVDLGNVKNIVKRSDIVMTNVQLGSSEIKIEGSEFELVNEKGQVVAVALSEPNGRVMFRRVPYGTYTIRQKQVGGAGYLGNEAVVPVTVEKEGENIELADYINPKIVGGGAWKYPKPNPTPQPPTTPTNPEVPVKPETPVVNVVENPTKIEDKKKETKPKTKKIRKRKGKVSPKTSDTLPIADLGAIAISGLALAELLRRKRKNKTK